MTTTRSRSRSTDPEPLLTSQEAADFLGVQLETMMTWRYRRQGPPWLKVSHKVVRYSPNDLQDWLDTRRRDHTDDLE